MTIDWLNENGVLIALVKDITIQTPQDALDLMANVRYQKDCDHIILNQESLSESFFDLKTGIAGEILQKYTNYRMKIAIVGDFSAYTSKPLQDFIRESNKGNQTFFLQTEAEAVARLAGA